VNDKPSRTVDTSVLNAILAISYNMSLPVCILTISCLFLLASDVLSQVQRDTSHNGLDQNVENTQLVNESLLLRRLETSKKHHDKKFDFLMFTQLWPISNCIDWEKRDSDNTCTLNKDFEWTVHGIWPTKKHTKGPYNCRNDLPFNEGKLDPILKQLDERWLNVRNGTGEYSFWKHEWLKHGTCAVQVEDLNTEFKFFDQGLKWRTKYDMHTILARAGINPGGQYQPKNVLDVVGKYLGSTVKKDNINPAITCRHEKGYQNQIIFELVICFDKELNLIHCDDVASGRYGSCPQDESYIVYPQSPDLGWTTTRYAMIFSACFLLFAFFFVGALYRERTRLGPPQRGCCWNKCYRCCGTDDDYVHPFIIDNYDNDEENNIKV